MKTAFKRAFRYVGHKPATRSWYKTTAARTERRRVRREIAAGNEPVPTPDGVRLNAWDIA